MAEVRVNPTRMELKKYKAKLQTARRGHKLLKDKRDELMKQFLDTVREAKELREGLCGRFENVYKKFETAAALTDPKMMTEALLLPGSEGELSVSEKNIMSVYVPVFDYKVKTSGDMGGAGYGYAFTSGSLDDAAKAITEVSAELVRMAQLEKTALLLCDEIERTRRRVNALEYIMIPQYEQTVKSITMKLDENERSSQTRLMKVKDMMIKAQLQAKHADEDEDEENA